MITETQNGFKLGITGGIGSGKTSVCRVFDVLRIPVFSADKTASEIMESEGSIRSKLNSIAGKDLYLNGHLDRMLLASIIFNNTSVLDMVNALVHPVVFDHFRSWSATQTAPYVIMEAAILFESGASKFVDRVATVVAPLEQRVERVIRRNKLSREQVLERMKNQMDDESMMKISDYVISNAENDMIIPAILKIHDNILTFIKTRN